MQPLIVQHVRIGAIIKIKIYFSIKLHVKSPFR